jgi:UDP-3-O-[3-hydroxymyristoyl] glucosamine N-acyltransferase
VQLTARDIAQLTGGQLTGNPDEPITGVAGIKEAQPGDLTFVGSPKYLSAVKTTRASVIILDHKGAVQENRTLIRVDNPSQAFAFVVQHLLPPPVSPRPGIHSSAIIAATARLGKDVSIEAHAVIADGAVLGERCAVGAGSYIGHECEIGASCHIYPHVTLRERTRLGNNVILHSGVVLGADGFGFETAGGQHKKIPQLGTVEIGDDVEIGANTTIDRARFGKTRVGKGTKIDNLVQIGHNCVIGEDCIICGLVGIAGSTVIEDHVTIAGQVGIAGHLTIGTKSIIMAQAGVTKDVPPGSLMLGAPAVPHTKFNRVNAATQRLPELAEKVRDLQREVAELRMRLDTLK